MAYPPRQLAQAAVANQLINLPSIHPASPTSTYFHGCSVVGVDFFGGQRRSSFRLAPLCVAVPNHDADNGDMDPGKGVSPSLPESGRGGETPFISKRTAS